MSSSFTIIQCDPASHVKRKLARTIPERVWTSHREEITWLHRFSVTQDGICRRLGEKYNFHPTRRQMWAKMNEWGLRTYSRVSDECKDVAMVEMDIKPTQTINASTTVYLDGDIDAIVRRGLFLAYQELEFIAHWDTYFELVTPEAIEIRRQDSMSRYAIFRVHEPRYQEIMLLRHGRTVAVVREMLSSCAAGTMPFSYWFRLLTSILVLYIESYRTNIGRMGDDAEQICHKRAAADVLDRVAQVLGSTIYKHLVPFIASILQRPPCSAAMTQRAAAQTQVKDLSGAQ